MPAPAVAIIGAGFAGSEAAWQLARRGHAVRLYEMRPVRMTEAHQGADCAELVCSNSFKSTNVENAHGLLKAEMAVQGSLILEVAREAAVPAGQALAVDRERFARGVTERLEAHPAIELCREEVRSLEPLLAAHRYVMVATGPLTSPELAEALRPHVGEGYLYFHDAIAPVVTAESIDRSVAFAAARYGKGAADYLNCPLDEAEYRAFVAAVRDAETVDFHAFESLRPFEGCLPIEVMVQRGELTLAYGPMKPVGLTDPRTGRRPFAVVQLRQENRQGSLYSLVGFQTKMTWPEQRRVLRMIPGLEQAQFARLGSLHRNTFINAPTLLDADLGLRAEPRLVFAGQITGVEGYMESTAMGLYAAKRIAGKLSGVERPRPSPATMTGGLLRYLLETPPAHFQPMNSAFGLLDPLEERMGKRERKAAQARRALAEMERLEALEGLRPEPSTAAARSAAGGTAPCTLPRSGPAGLRTHDRSMDASQLLTHRLNNALHALLLLGGLAVLLAAIGWVLGGPSGLLWTAILGGAALVLTPRISPALILRMYQARPLHRMEAPALHDLVERLAARAELPYTPALYYVPTPIMNAFSVGHRSDAVIAVTDGLLRGLSPREVSAVLAHEMAHIGHNDMWIMSLADSVSRIVRGMSLVGQLLILINLPVFLMRGGGMPWIPLLLLVFAPTLSALLQLALSRNREFDADVEAARLTGDPQGLAEALTKLEAQQERMWQQVLWPGYRNRQPSLLRTHPNSEARIERLRTLAPGTAGFTGADLPHSAVHLQPDGPRGRPRHRWHGLWF